MLRSVLQVLLKENIKIILHMVDASCGRIRHLSRRVLRVQKPVVDGVVEV